MTAIFRRNMWRRFAALMLVVASLVSISCKDDDEDSNDRFLASEHSNFRMMRTSQTQMFIFADDGSIEITGDSDVDSVIVDAERRVIADTQEDANSGLLELVVLFGRTDTSFIASTSYFDMQDGREYEVHYRITMPEDMLVFVDQSRGNIEITNLAPPNNTSQPATIHTSIGNVQLENVRTGIICDVLGGNISYTTEFLNPHACELTLMQGAITVTLPENYSAAFEATIETGTISVTGLELVDAVITPTHVTGTLGTGEGSIDLQLTTGTITATGN